MCWVECRLFRICTKFPQCSACMCQDTVLETTPNEGSKEFRVFRMFFIAFGENDLRKICSSSAANVFLHMCSITYGIIGAKLRGAKCSLLGEIIVYLLMSIDLTLRKLQKGGAGNIYWKWYVLNISKTTAFWRNSTWTS